MPQRGTKRKRTTESAENKPQNLCENESYFLLILFFLSRSKDAVSFAENYNVAKSLIDKNPKESDALYLMYSELKGKFALIDFLQGIKEEGERFREQGLPQDFYYQYRLWKQIVLNEGIEQELFTFLTNENPNASAFQEILERAESPAGSCKMICFTEGGVSSRSRPAAPKKPRTSYFSSFKEVELKVSTPAQMHMTFLPPEQKESSPTSGLESPVNQYSSLEEADPLSVAEQVACASSLFGLGFFAKGEEGERTQAVAKPSAS